MKEFKTFAQAAIKNVNDGTLQKAVAIACLAHIDQADKGGNPYIEHVARVAGSFHCDVLKSVAYLHDVIEDTDVTAEDLMEWSITPNIVDAVIALTKTKNEPRKEYIKRVKNNPLARFVKLADLQDNLNISRILEPTKRDIERCNMYRLELAYLMGD